MENNIDLAVSSLLHQSAVVDREIKQNLDAFELEELAELSDLFFNLYRVVEARKTIKKEVSK